MTSIIADFGSFITSTLGIVSALVLAFVAGTVIGTPVWNWVKSKLPFSK
jgi:hypothetical protein